MNLTEVLTRLQDLGVPDETADGAVAELMLQVIPFDETQARAAADLRRQARRAGLSLGDRACLALSQSMDRTAVTADRAWAGLDVGVEVVLIR